MYKPFQYYHKKVDIGFGKDHMPICEIDSLENATVKDLLAICIWISLVFVGMSFIFIILCFD